MEIEAKEQLLRIVTPIGNGGHIFAPKEWINEKVLITRIEKKTVKEELIEIISPHLDKIIAVFLYGSHARNEANEDSDIDVLIIAKEKFNINNKNNNFEFIIINEEFLNEAIKLNPIMMYSVFNEAKPIINSKYFDSLKQIKIDLNLFKQFIKTTKESIASNEEILDLDKKTGKFASNSIIYSLILRLRGISIINSLINHKSYTNASFKKFILNNCNINYDKIYKIYQLIRQNKQLKDEVLIESVISLNNFLKLELKKLEAIVNKNGRA